VFPQLGAEDGGVDAKQPGRLAAIARREPGVAFFLDGRRLGPPAPGGLERSVWLTLDGRRVGKVVAGVRLDVPLSRRLTVEAPHAKGDRLVLVRRGRLVGGTARFTTRGRTVLLGNTKYRSLVASVADAPGVRLLALRPEEKIAASVRPYQERVRYAALGSFALLVLVAFMFAGPILRMLGDFRRVASQATTDGLTGLANRRSFDEELALEWRRAHRIGDSLALVLLDLDNFKQVNDTYGHPAGDAVLRAIGELLATGVRQIDLAARYGGEEFVVLVPESDLDGAAQLAKRLRAALGKVKVELADGTKLKVTASFGVAASGELETAEELVAAADEALYDAKRAGKDRVVAAGATIDGDAGLGKGGLRAESGRRARSSVERRSAPKRRPNRSGAEDPA
jgi:diguanylate cyclase (GGDEF)-like protein